MSLAEDIRADGFDTLLDLDGETVTFAGRSDLQVSAIVNRAPSLRPDDKRVPDFSEREQSVIAVKRSAISPLPRSGESATDQYGHIHRVVTVEPRGDFYYLHCEVTPGTVGQ